MADDRRAAGFLLGRSSKVLLTVGAAALLGCGDPTPPQSASPPPPPPSSTSKQPEDGWGIFRSKRFGLDLALPDGETWAIDDTTRKWLIAKHAPTSAEIAVRKWRVGLGMNRTKCREQAAFERELPADDALAVLEEVRIDKPESFDTTLQVAIDPGAPGIAPRGFVLAFGGWAADCFALVYQTTGMVGREIELAERLATMADAVHELRFHEADEAIDRSRPDAL